MTPREAADVLTNALILKRERVTADSIDEKQAQKDWLKRVISAMQAWQDDESTEPVTVAVLRDTLGEDDPQVREALSVWAAE